MNLRKLYPFIPVTLNSILMHFSTGAGVYYEAVEEIIEDFPELEPEDIHMILEL